MTKSSQEPMHFPLGTMVDVIRYLWYLLNTNIVNNKEQAIKCVNIILLLFS